VNDDDGSAMNIDDDDTDDNHDTGDHGDGIAILELLAEAIIAARDLALNAKIKPAELKKRAKFERGLVDIQAKCAALTAHAEETKAALDERAAELDARAAQTERRATECEASLREAYDHLRGYYDNLAQEDRRIRYRILTSADLLHGYNSQLQDLPSWQVIRQLVVGLPDDPPPLEREVAHPRIDALSDTFSDPNADRHGHVFLGTLTRDVSHRA
jgi:hypothetical protein